MVDLKFRFTYVICFIVLCSALAFGQRPVARIAELESDGHYSTLIGRFDYLTVKADSIGARIEDIRKIFAADAPDKDKYSDELIGLEMEHYKLRDTISALTREISAIEQKWMIDNIERGQNNESMDSGGGVPYLSENGFFRQMLSHEDYMSLLRAQEAESTTQRLIGDIRSNYGRMAAVESVYRAAGKEQADSLYLILSGLAANNETLAEDLHRIWDDVFDSKVYTYNYILDKAGMVRTMADMERLMVDVSLRPAETDGQYMYDAVAAYPFRKSLLLRYETAIASEKGFTAAFCLWCSTIFRFN